MTIRVALLTLLTISMVSVKAQDSWISDRQLYARQEGQQDYPLYYLYRGITYDYKYDESGNLVCDYTNHVITRVSNDDALETVNKIYIPMYDVIEVLNIQSRTISREGKVIELDERNIKEVKDEASESGYKIFAVEGAEVGGEVEYLYTKRVNSRNFGTENLQFNAPIRQLNFVLTCPENLEFDFFIANDTAQVVQTDTSDDHNRYELSVMDVPAFDSEPFSAGDANKKRVEIKLAYNTNVSQRRINTYPDAGKVVYQSATDLSKKEQKRLDKFIQQYDPRQGSVISRLRQMEHEFKKRSYQEDNAPDDLVFLLDNNMGHKRAFVKLFVGLLRYLQIDFEIVVSSDRFNSRFVEDFDSWNLLSEYLIYLPEQDTYLAPHHVNFRYGSIPMEVLETKGLFIREELITDFYFPLTRIGNIPSVPYQHNMNDLDITVNLDETLSTARVKVIRSYVGNEANYFKSALLWMNQEQKEEMLDEQVYYLAPDADIEKVEVIASNNTWDKWDERLMIEASFSTSAYLERAGNTLILKAGELIGPQSELYQDKERKFEVENTNNRGYYREIRIHIPEGYVIQNPQDLVLDKKVYEGKEPIFVFESKYELEDNLLTITIDEYYNRLFYPVEKFEDFRKVINAAADWNKVNLILKPQNK